MKNEPKVILGKRLHKNYEDFLAQLQGKSTSELIAMAPEITAAKQCHDELLDACNDDDVAFLLRFDNPLEVVSGYWESEITGYDKSGEIGHMLWNIREEIENDTEGINMSDNTIKQITADDLRHMSDSEGLILQGCGGDLQEWVDGINDLLTEAGILLDGSKFETVSTFQHDGLTNLLFPFENVKLDMSRLAMWRLQTHDRFGGTWLSDYVVAKSAPSVSAYGENSDRSLAPPSPTQPATLGLRGDPDPNRLGGSETEQAAPQKPKMKLLGQDGNIFNILGQASRLLKQAGQNEQADEMFNRVSACGGYYQALNIISEYVETELSAPPKPQKSTRKKGRNAHER